MRISTPLPSFFNIPFSSIHVAVVLCGKSTVTGASQTGGLLVDRRIIARDRLLHIGGTRLTCSSIHHHIIVPVFPFPPPLQDSLNSPHHSILVLTLICIYIHSSASPSSASSSLSKISSSPSPLCEESSPATREGKLVRQAINTPLSEGRSNSDKSHQPTMASVAASAEEMAELHRLSNDYAPVIPVLASKPSSTSFADLPSNFHSREIW